MEHEDPRVRLGADFSGGRTSWLTQETFGPAESEVIDGSRVAVTYR